VNFYRVSAFVDDIDIQHVAIPSVCLSDRM